MNSNLFKKSAIVLIALLAVLQFIHPGRNEGAALGPNDITQSVTVPETVMKSLEKSCFDCHSNHTVYPWYASVQPLGFWLDHHVDEGKGEINFSEFNTYSLKRKAHKMEEIAEMLEEDEMPLSSYTLIHKDAVMSDAQKAEMIQWAKANHDALKQQLEAEKANAGASADTHQEHHE